MIWVVASVGALCGVMGLGLAVGAILNTDARLARLERRVSRLRWRLKELDDKAEEAEW